VQALHCICDAANSYAFIPFCQLLTDNNFASSPNCHPGLMLFKMDFRASWLQVIESSAASFNFELQHLESFT
jgi:hypothetical protein